ncbi:hypothetical protein VTK26DRAFT_4562 [Humicola hyalothermophila]
MAFRKGVSFSQQAKHSLEKDVDFPNGPTDTVSALRWSPASNHVAAASWDGKVYIYDATNSTSTASIKGVAAITAAAPFLDCDFTKDGTLVAGAATDKQVHVMALSLGQTMTLQGHDAPVRTVRFVDVPSANAPIIASGSWDKTVRYWDLRQPNPIGALQLSERVYAMDAAGPLLVAATADNQVHLVNLRGNPLEIQKTVKSPLTAQARSVAVCKDGSRWAICGIDGRAAAQVTDEKDKSMSNLSFKCHRVPHPTKKNQTDVYAVHAVSFSPAAAHRNAILATAGSDGTFNVWDICRRQRQLNSPKVADDGSLTALTFNADGTALVYAVGYDWSKGYLGNKNASSSGSASGSSGAKCGTRVVLHKIQEGVLKK